MFFWSKIRTCILKIFHPGDLLTQSSCLINYIQCAFPISQLLKVTRINFRRVLHSEVEYSVIVKMSCVDLKKKFHFGKWDKPESLFHNRKVIITMYTFLIFSSSSLSYKIQSNKCCNSHYQDTRDDRSTQNNYFFV